MSDVRTPGVDRGLVFSAGPAYSQKVRDAPKRRRGRPKNDFPLVVWGERREEPDWDGFIAALIDQAMREVEREESRARRS